MTDHNDTGATARPWVIPAGDSNEHVICAGDDAGKPGRIICILHPANFSGDRLSYDELTAVAALIVEAVNAYEPLKARLAEVERERGEAKTQFAKTWARALAAEARVAVLERALRLALSEHDHRRSMQITLTEPDWVQVARTTLAEQKEAGK